MKNTILFFNRSLIFLVCCIFFTKGKSQDHHFSMIYENNVYLNPANAGLFYPIGISFSYRQQWRSLAYGYNTALFSVDGRIYSTTGGSILGGGLIVIKDISGETRLNTTNINMVLMGKVMLNENNNISAGIVGGIMERKIDNSKLKLTEQHNDLGIYDANVKPETFETYKRLAPDVGAGVQWSYGRGATTLSANDPLGIQVGLTFFHLNKPNTSFKEDFDKRNIRGMGHFNITYGIRNTPLQICGQGIIQFQGINKMVYPGLKVRYLLQEQSRYTGFLFSRSLTIGGFYRLNDAFVISLNLEWDQFFIGISYDLTLSGLAKATKGFGAIEGNIKYIPVRPEASSKLI